MEHDHHTPENVVQFPTKTPKTKKPILRAIGEIGAIIGVAGIAASTASLVHDNSNRPEPEPNTQREFYLKDTNLNNSQEFEVSGQTFVVSVASAVILVSALTKLKFDEE